MTTRPTFPATPQTDANLLATMGAQSMLDALHMELGALQAIMPGLAPADRVANPREAESEDMFDNMPV